MTELADITLPPLGEGVTEATFVEWLVRPGAAFAKGDAIAEVMTDKVGMEVEAEADGVLEEAIAKADQEVPAGAVLGRYRPAG